MGAGEVTVSSLNRHRRAFGRSIEGLEGQSIERVETDGGTRYPRTGRPRSSSGQNGLWASSQRLPSGSATYPL